MNATSGRLQQRLGGILAYAYRSLVLYVLFISVLLLIVDDGGWINYFIVFLVLSSPLALALVCRRLRRKRTEPDRP